MHNIQWNLAVTDTIGSLKSYREVSAIKRIPIRNLQLVPRNGVCYREVSAIKHVRYEEVSLCTWLTYSSRDTGNAAAQKSYRKIYLTKGSPDRVLVNQPSWSNSLLVGLSASQSVSLCVSRKLLISFFSREGSM